MKEVAELEPSQILTTRTRGGGSDRTSSVQNRVQEPLHKPKKPARKLKLSTEASEDLASEDGSTIAQKVKEKVVEASKQLLDLSKDLEQSTMGQTSEVLKTHMKV